MVAAPVYERLATKLRQTLALYHEENPLKAGLPKEELRALLYRGLEQRFFQFLLNALQKKGDIAQDEGLVRLAGHTVSLGADEKALREKLAALYREAGLAPPTRKEMHVALAGFREELVREVLTVMVRDGVLTKVSEDLYFDGAALDGLRQKLAALLQRDGEIDTPGFKDLTGLSRKFSIPLLEYFDRTKLTIRVGDKRILREKQHQ